MSEKKGVKEFPDFVFAQIGNMNANICLCVRCNNAQLKTCNEMESGLIINGIV